MEGILMKRTWRQDPNDSKNFVEVTNSKPVPHLAIHREHGVSVSPIDGSIIRNNRQLIDHNKRHGVSNDLDSLREQTAKHNAPKVETKESIHQRKLDIKDAIEQVSSSGYHRQVNYDE